MIKSGALSVVAGLFGILVYFTGSAGEAQVVEGQAVDANGDPISGSPDEGEWNGRFFGYVELDNDFLEPGNQSTLPSGVAGDLEGHFNNGDIIGAFGAERTEVEE